MRAASQVKEDTAAAGIERKVTWEAADNTLASPQWLSARIFVPIFQSVSLVACGNLLTGEIVIAITDRANYSNY